VFFFSVHIPIHAVRPGYGVTYLNKRAQRALGRSPKEKSNVTVEPIIENTRGII